LAQGRFIVKAMKHGLQKCRDEKLFILPRQLTQKVY